MKIKFVFLICIFASIFCYAQNEPVKDVALIDRQKDYLYELYHLNKGNILSFEKESHENSKILLIKEIVKNNLQIVSYINLPYSIQEENDSSAILVNVFFIKLQSSELPILKSQSGEVVPNKVTLTYKWSVEGDVLIFTFTSRSLDHPYQKYVPN